MPFKFMTSTEQIVNTHIIISYGYGRIGLWLWPRSLSALLHWR